GAGPRPLRRRRRPHRRDHPADRGRDEAPRKIVRAALVRRSRPWVSPRPGGPQRRQRERHAAGVAAPDRIPARATPVSPNRGREGPASGREKGRTMKRILCLAAGILVVVPILAEQPVGLPIPIAGPTPTLGELLTTTQAMRAQQATVVNAGAEFNYQLLVDVAINAPGRFGTMYRSDYFLSNIRSVNQEVLIGWIAAGVNNAGASTQRFSLN